MDGSEFIFNGMNVQCNIITTHISTWSPILQAFICHFLILDGLDFFFLFFSHKLIGRCGYMEKGTNFEKDRLVSSKTIQYLLNYDGDFSLILASHIKFPMFRFPSFKREEEKYPFKNILKNVTKKKKIHKPIQQNVCTQN